MNISRVRRIVILTAAVGIVVLLVQAHYFSRPRVLAVSEVPVAFWAWRTQAPTNTEVEKAFNATNAKALFLRAGQFDLADAEVKRIRAVSGALPSPPDLHLVYNGTRKLLSALERIDTGKLAGVVADTYRSDLSRAANENVEVRGLQLDLDVPTRLLPRYGQILRHVREMLPPGAALSVTGLPTWADSNDIHAVLEAVDFWIPQCYGANIPTRMTERIPISSPKEVERTMAKVRKLEKPFYAGLSAYSYAILYDKNGDLIELRGDIDPSAVSMNKDLELAATQTFKGDAQTSQIRREYRAKSDFVLDGLVIHAGETLVFDLPTAASLRASARAVRENAGELLLGICLFRLPTAEDRTTLRLEEITSALNDRETKASTNIKLEAISDQQLRIVAENTGNAGSALTIDLEIPAGSVSGVYGLSGFDNYEPLCSVAGKSPVPCSGRRANIVRLKAAVWTPGASAWATLSVTKPLPASITASVTTRINDGRVEQKFYEIKIQNRGE
jgi:Protein of unknown function (DUF3142)